MLSDISCHIRPSVFSLGLCILLTRARTVLRDERTRPGGEELEHALLTRLLSSIKPSKNVISKIFFKIVQKLLYVISLLASKLRSTEVTEE